MASYMAWNGIAPVHNVLRLAQNSSASLTAPAVTLQVAAPATNKLKLKRWGVRFTAAPTAVVRVELLEVTTATTLGTAHVAAGVTPYGDAGAPASSVTLSTSTTAWGSTAATTVGAARTADEWVAPIGVSYYDYEWSLGEEFDVAVSRFVQVRAASTVATPLITYLIWDE